MLFQISLVLFILLPTVLVFFGCYPIHNVFSTRNDLGGLDLLAFMVTYCGIAFEMYADSQLRAAVRKNAATNKGNLFLYDKGLWSLCRHPNYFGEIMFWFGLSLFSVAVGVKVTWTQFIGPIGIFCIILFGSLPMMEKRQLERKPELYKRYMKEVPYKLFPLNFFRKF